MSVILEDIWSTSQLLRVSVGPCLFDSIFDILDVRLSGVDWHLSKGSSFCHLGEVKALLSLEGWNNLISMTEHTLFQSLSLANQVLDTGLFDIIVLIWWSSGWRRGCSGILSGSFFLLVLSRGIISLLVSIIGCMGSIWWHFLRVVNMIWASISVTFRWSTDIGSPLLRGRTVIGLAGRWIMASHF